ncbi:MAG TPA: insulinase family protein, partial [Hyphomicrobiaceae bacterium]|nr:insulinase family protein [Hyphomicrobiaceae bacterium]
MSSIISRLSVLRSPARRLAQLVVAATALAVVSAPALALPEVRKVVSPGGIEAWLMELHDAPLLTVRLGFGAGNLHNPGGKFGVAPMTEYMFDEGAG